LKLELIVKLHLKATHTLEENETPHEHEWRVDVTLSGGSNIERVISLPLAHEIFSQTLNKLSGTHLNSSLVLDSKTRAVPTCENLAFFFMEEFSQDLRRDLRADPALKISLIEVGVLEENGREMGAARLTP
jgi:6-pyruvoyl-tetrahydropterin synthase